MAMAGWAGAMAGAGAMDGWGNGRLGQWLARAMAGWGNGLEGFGSFPQAQK